MRKCASETALAHGNLPVRQFSKRWGLTTSVASSSCWGKEEKRKNRFNPMPPLVSQGRANPTLFCEVVHWVARCHIACCSVPPVLTMCCVDDFNGPGEESGHFGSSEKTCHAHLCKWGAVNCQKRAVGFPEGPVNLIKKDLSLISCKFLVCDMHRQLLW